jgi:hypothetical protein
MRTSVATACFALTQWMVPFTLRSAPGMPWRVSGSSVQRSSITLPFGILDQFSHLMMPTPRRRTSPSGFRRWKPFGGTSAKSSRSIHNSRANGTSRVPKLSSFGWLANVSVSSWPSGRLVSTSFSGSSTAMRRAAVTSRSSRMQFFQHRVVDHAVLLADADAFDQQAQPGRREAAPAQAAQRVHARIVPAVDVAFADQLRQLALAGDGVAEVEARELDLARLRRLRRQAAASSGCHSSGWFGRSTLSTNQSYSGR